jgi:hypothetical protein
VGGGVVCVTDTYPHWAGAPPSGCREEGTANPVSQRWRKQLREYAVGCWASATRPHAQGHQGTVNVHGAYPRGQGLSVNL